MWSLQEIDLHNNNQLLRAKVPLSLSFSSSSSLCFLMRNIEFIEIWMQIAESERNASMIGGDFELMQSHPYDPRDFFQVNGLQHNNNHQYPRQDNMALQLV